MTFAIYSMSSKDIQYLAINLNENLQINHSFESNLFNELVDPVHKTSLNDLFMNQTDPFHKFHSLTQ